MGYRLKKLLNGENVCQCDAQKNKNSHDNSTLHKQHISLGSITLHGGYPSKGYWRDIDTVSDV